MNTDHLHHLLEENLARLQADWLAHLAVRQSPEQQSARTVQQLAEQARQFLAILLAALNRGADAEISSAQWLEVRGFLEDLSRRQASAGLSMAQTAQFVFSLKAPLFSLLRELSPDNSPALVEQLVFIGGLVDELGLYTVSVHQADREQIILRQQEEMLELSTPVVKLWDGILALPIIGTLDSGRTQVVMESLLNKILETDSHMAIIDITGVPTVDTLVAQHLLKTVAALRLMGADCIISGVRPQIAQTIVHLGVDLEGVTSKSNLADALALALERCGVRMGHA